MSTEHNPGRENIVERANRFLRNINIIGAVALGGAGIALESTILTTWGAINAGQAGFFEMTRRAVKRREKEQPAR